MAKLNIITAVIAFILFFSMIPVVLSLEHGFMVAEFIIFIILLIIGAAAILKLLSGKYAGGCMFVFFMLNAINVFAIFTRTFEFCILIIPVVATIIGLYISAFKIKKNSYEDAEIEPYYETEHEVEVEEPKKKKTRKTKKKAK